MRFLRTVLGTSLDQSGVMIQGQIQGQIQDQNLESQIPDSQILDIFYYS